MINIYDSAGELRGTTSKLIECTVVEELMRGHTLDFVISNDNPTRPEITHDCGFEQDGQYYDVFGVTMTSGTENKTAVHAEHVSYRLNDYTVPPGYSFVGTPTAIAQDILDISGASDEFTVSSESAGVSKSFKMNNQNDVTARAAILALNALDVEIEFDNYDIRLVDAVGGSGTTTMTVGVDIISLQRTWSRTDGESYDISLARPASEIPLGRKVKIVNAVLGDGTVIDSRVVARERHPDNPTLDEITLGAFARDSSDDAVAAQVAIDNKITAGGLYNNVSIDRANGMTCVRSDGKVKTVSNATVGFATYVYKSGKWEVTTILGENGLQIGAYDEALEGKLAEGVAYNNVSITKMAGFVCTHTNGKIKIVANADVCFAVYTRKNTSSEWVLKTAVDEDGLAAASIRTVGSDLYGVIGMIGGTYGLKLTNADGDIFSVVPMTDGSDIIGWGLFNHKQSTTIPVIVSNKRRRINRFNNKNVFEATDDATSLSNDGNRVFSGTETGYVVRSGNGKNMIQSIGDNFVVTVDGVSIGADADITVVTPVGNLVLHFKYGLFNGVG
ncbi:MAG: hypothetical protein QM689_12800 [Oscillospiraceae bacterium]